MQDKKKKTDFLIPCQEEYFLLTYLKTVTLKPFGLLSYFLQKKYLLVGATGMFWTGQWMSE